MLSLLNSLATPRTARDEYTQPTLVLSQLYAEQLAITPGVAYLEEHARPRAVLGQVSAFRWYRQFLPPVGALLDWGCNHAPDSCLIRAATGDQYDLHACDLGPAGRFVPFHEYAGLTYTSLAHPYQLPYDDNRFDGIIGSGALEHAVMDYESLKELHRVLRPHGTLIITYLPNRWSIQEWRRRVIDKRDYHLRRYGLTETHRMLTHCGFEVLDGRNQALDPRLPGLRALIGATARTLLPLHWFSGALCFAARKLTCM